MLHSITWQSFILILLALIAGYYILSVVFFYRRDGIGLLKTCFSGSDRVKVGNLETEVGIPLEGKTMWDVMGAVSEDVFLRQDDPESVASEDLVFVDDPDSLPESFRPLLDAAAPADTLLIGSVADLLQEIKMLFKMLHEYNSPKDEGCSLLQSLLTKYPHLAESSFKDSITEYVCDLSRKNLPYELVFQEVTSFWQHLPVE